MAGIFQNFIAGQQAGQARQEFTQGQDALARQQQFNQLASQYLGTDTVQSLGVPSTGAPAAQAQTQQPVDESQGPPQYAQPQQAAPAAPQFPDMQGGGQQQQLLSQLVALDPGRALELEKVRTGRAQQQQGQIYNLATRALDSGKPAAMLKYLLSADTIGGLNIKAVREGMQQQGVDINAITDEQATTMLQSIQSRAAAGAGILPDAPFTLNQGDVRFGGGGNVIAGVPTATKNAFETLTPQQVVQAGLPPGTSAQRDRITGKIDVLAPTKPNSFETLSPQQIADAGLPAGTAAQRDRTTGKIDVLSKRDNTNSLSQKDAAAAKIKLNLLKVAKQQLAVVRDRFNKIRGTAEAGPGQFGSFPTRNGKLFDKAIDTMRGSIGAVTHVPGIGSMSNYDAQLDQSKFPERSGYEDVTDQQLDALELQLNTMESGYRDALGSPDPDLPTAPVAARNKPAAGSTAKPVPVKSRAEALNLAPGTLFKTPDGRILRRQ